MITVFRVTQREYQDSAFNGDGTYRRGGRWISPRRNAVFASDSLALASQEYLVNIPMGFLVVPELVFFQAELDEDQVIRIERDGLPEGWDGYPYNQVTQEMGDHWFDRKESLALCVPSAVIPVGDNYVLNSRHPEFTTLRISEAREFSFDARLMALMRASLELSFISLKKKKE